ncbi:hypothetical protein B0A50_00477 [Salinomyces thailandicus]|uniref:Uncharacterized protein n=1 Tax=Salinomyces thailandicus TaxID=706561 RepID=A0A4U0UDP8_9PEZI|nr:hypothetical protein B0A50_00477 [Salinomyces thailandica]
MGQSTTSAGAQVAATKAWLPEDRSTRSGAPYETQPRPTRNGTGLEIPTQAQNARGQYQLPSVQRESDLSADLQHLTVSGAGGVGSRDAYMPTRSAPNPPQRKAVPAQPNGMARSQGNAHPLPPSYVPAPLTVQKGTSAGSPMQSPVSPVGSSKSRSLSRKADHRDLRKSPDMARSGNEAMAASRSNKRNSLDKPLPPAPSDDFEADLDGDRVMSRDYKPDLTGLVDLTNTEDTTLHERWAPAVTHETIRQDVHHIREEVITREIHNHHVYHRILPIVDIEVLPARHFVPVDGGYAEISEDEVPGQTGVNAQWVIAETLSKLLPESKGPVIPQQFSAAKFQGPDWDDKEYVGKDGVKRTEQWWVHPPTIETGARDSGQSYPFYMGFPDPKDNGLRAKLPHGNVIGVSPLLAKQQREHMRLQQESAGEGMGGRDEKPPPVPEHKTLS